MLNRYSTDIQGYVNFPIKDPSFEHTYEGGMFVKLVVLYNNEYPVVVCSGGCSYIIYDETLVGYDQPEPPKMPRVEAHNPPHIFEKYIEEDREYKELHFPYINSCSQVDAAKYVSIPYLVIITLGSTGWSGYHSSKKEYWRCTKEDLTTKGLDLYNSIQKLYPNNQIVLQTWLDT